MAGFANDVVYASNVDFSGGSPVSGQVTTDGQILIGSTSAPHIRVGTISAGEGVYVTNGSGSIALSQGPVIGELAYFPTQNGTTYLNGKWLLCDGSILSQATYPTLYSRVGLLNPGGSIWSSISTGSLTSLQSIAYGNSTYVTVGFGGLILTSTDLNTWTQRTSGTTTSITSVIYGNSQFVAAGQSGYLATSTDAITWTLQNSGYVSTINSITYGGGQYVYVGVSGGTVFTSTDAVSWKTRTPVGGALAYSGTKYVSLNTYGIPASLYTSTDFVDWDVQTLGTSTSTIIQCVAFGNSTYVYGGYSGILASSTDAITWTSRTSGTSSTILAITYGGSKFVYVGNAGSLATSTDGITWTTRSSGSTSSITSIAFGNSTYVYGAFGGGISSSTDAVTWVARTSGTTSNINAVTFGNSLFVAGGAGGVLLSSTDGTTWTSRTSGTTSSINSLAYGNSKYVYVGVNGAIGSSTDAITWTSGNIGIGISLNYLIFDGSVFRMTITGGGIQRLWTSTDGITWTLNAGSGTTTNLNVVGYGNSQYLYGGFGGILATSTDAKTWTLRTSGTTNSITALNWSGSLYNYGTNSPTFGYSNDAITWNTTSAGASNGITNIGNIYVSAGAGTIFASSDGINWYQQPTPSGINTMTGIIVTPSQFLVSAATGKIAVSSTTYSYNPATQFQLPTENNVSIVTESKYSFPRSLFIRAL